MKNKSAFPIHPNVNTEQFSGMTLRDYFAAKAMQSYVNSISSENWFNNELIKNIAVESYKQADAMLSERDK